MEEAYLPIQKPRTCLTLTWLEGSKSAGTRSVIVHSAALTPGLDTDTHHRDCRSPPLRDGADRWRLSVLCGLPHSAARRQFLLAPNVCAFLSCNYSSSHSTITITQWYGGGGKTGILHACRHHLRTVICFTITLLQGCIAQCWTPCWFAWGYWFRFCGDFSTVYVCHVDGLLSVMNIGFIW